MLGFFRSVVLSGSAVSPTDRFRVRRPLAGLFLLCAVACKGPGWIEPDDEPDEEPPPGPSALALTTDLGSLAVQGESLHPVQSIELRDAFNRVVPKLGVTVTATLVSGEPDATLEGTTAVTDFSGRADFSALTIHGNPGPSYAISFTSPGLQSITTPTFRLLPQGRIASWTVGTTAWRLVVVNPDGSERRENVEFVLGHGQYSPASEWSPNGRQLVYHAYATDGGQTALRLFVLDPDNWTQRRLIAPGSRFEAELYPTFSPDGQWIYFSGRVGASSAEIWRVKTDGTGPERVGPAAGAGTHLDANPSVSPDGQRLVYGHVGNADSSLRVLTLSSGAIDSIAPYSSAARWSPVADEIAYLQDHGVIADVVVVTSHGANKRVVSQTGYQPGSLSWSPDGKLLVVRSANLLHLIDISTRSLTALPYSADLAMPSWSPMR